MLDIDLRILTIILIDAVIIIIPVSIIIRKNLINLHKQIDKLYFMLKDRKDKDNEEK